MCGIAGIFLTSGGERALLPQVLRMGQSMARRGPNDEGYLLVGRDGPPCPLAGDITPGQGIPGHFAPGEHIQAALDRPGSLFLAHRRLSILDVSPLGHQPMCTPDGRYWIVYNGEIYNFKDIRRELEGRGETFRGGSDTEVLVRAYAAWGPEALNRLNGMFAMAIWDARDRTLFCARDRVGIKPFYYISQPGLFAFASDISTLLASGLVRPEIHVEGLYYALSFGIAPRPMTCFTGVRSLEQSTWMLLDSDGRVTRQRYWRVPLGRQEPSMTEGEAAELLEEQLRAAIARRMVSDVPIGTFMSGGIDSTLVTALASQMHPGIHAFTLAFTDDRKLNELQQAREAASMYPIEHRVLDVRASHILDHIDDIVACYEEPFYDLAPNYLISKFVSGQGVVVVLNGLGGDELFGGYPYYGWLSRWRWLGRLRGPVCAAGALPGIGHLARRLCAVGRAATSDRFALAVRSFFPESEKRELFADPAVASLDTIEHIHRTYFDDIRPGDDFEGISAMDLINYIGNHQVHRTDRFTMRFSLECRLPLLDYELIEAASRIPTRWKRSAAGSKLVLRKVASDKIPASCLQAGKKGFDLPTDRWMRNELSGLVRDSIRDLGRRGIFREDAIRRVFNDWKLGVRSYRGMWQLVATELWIKRFIEQAP